MIHRGGCCCADDCEFCPGATPLRLRITFSGLALCTACYGSAPTNYVKWSTQPAAAPSGSYNLTQHPTDPCVWQYEEAASGVVTWYSDACSTPLVGFGPFTVAKLKIWAGVTAGQIDVHAFSDLQATATPCLGTTVFANDQAACGNATGAATEWLTGAVGGAATIAPA